MPSRRPCAAFEPIAPDFDMHALVEATPNFEFVLRIHCDMVEHQGLEKFERLILMHVILGGKPLVIEGYDTKLERWIFALQWLKDNCGSKVEQARDLTKKENVPLTISHYLNNMPLLTDQWTPQNYKDPDRQRMYLKDIDCPKLWHDKLRDLLPECIFYLNDSTGDLGGFGASNVSDTSGIGGRKGRGIARAGDLMYSLPTQMRAENLMCYIGHEGTYTPCHREMCASLGQNIMVEASTGTIENGKRTKPGSSIWFMTETKDRKVVGEYWLSRLGHDIEVENHFAQINAWRNAPFKTYVVEQKPGDFILIPPLAPHQVWNRGTRTMKVAWNRTTIETLEMALNEALPNARLVCRDEQYKNKAIIYFTLQEYSKRLRQAEAVRRKGAGEDNLRGSDDRVRQLEKDFRRLHHLYTGILISESFLPNQKEKNIEFVEFDSNITCSYCRANIFNRFLTCPSCVEDLGDGEQNTYDICMDCYAMGRSCACISNFTWVEQFPWSELTQKHEQWRQQILTFADKVDSRPMALRNELEKLGRRRTLAQICQVELVKRPWKDVKAPASDKTGKDQEDVDPTDTNGNLRKNKRKANQTDKFLREHARCHVDCHWEPKWKQAQCSKCEKRYCYGVLFRAYDMQPQDIMADPDWRCPSCRNICACRNCRTKPGYELHIPSGTLLGHNTKAIADVRSVESLVDFSFSNISWIQKAGDDNADGSKRLSKHKKEAEKAKATEPVLGDHYVDNDGDTPFGGVEAAILQLAAHENIPIDPALADTETGSKTGTGDEEDEVDENPEEAAKTHSPLLTVFSPQDLLPTGGILRDQQHAYEITDAITFDYPDPDANTFAPLPANSDPSSNAYVPADAPPSDKIEMINHKRKRPKVDDGDRPYGYKKTVPKQARKSLIVKFNIDKEKLQKVSELIQRGADGIADIPAPVIGSDLQALNANNTNADTLGNSKKSRVDVQLPVDKDDDFQPSRTRDRRKSGMPAEPPPPDETEIMRRPSRAAAPTHVYQEESDEDGFDEIIEEDFPAPTAGSKLATMEQSLMNNGSIPKSIMRNGQVDGKTDEHGVQNSTSLTEHASPAVVNVRSNVKPSQVTQAGLRLASSSSASNKLAKPVLSASSRGEEKAVAEARANRRAKMAAIEFMEDSDDDALHESFDEEELQTSEPPPSSNKVSANILSNKTIEQKSAPAPVVQLARQPVQPSTVPKANATDWSSDSSDDDTLTMHRSQGASFSWTSINAGSMGVAHASPSRGRGRGLGRGRGRGIGSGRG